MTRPDVQCEFRMTGTLLAHGEARARQIEGGPTVPALCLHVEIDAPTRPHAHVEQLFPVGHGEQCEAAARRYRKGARVTFEAPSVGVALLVRNATHVHLHARDEEPGAPAEATAA